MFVYEGGKEGDGGKDGKEKPGSHPPAKKYRMTENMKGIVWELVMLSNECCRLENEKKWAVFFSSVNFALMTIS